MTALLQVSALQLHGAPPAKLLSYLCAEHGLIVEEGARLRARLPASRVQRRTLLDAHCPLIAPLRAIVSGYEVPTITDEI
jgi:hypothetical protein